MTTVLVLGAYGLLGGSLVPHLRAAGFAVAAQGRSLGSDYRADPSSRSEVDALLDTVAPNIVVNLVAMTDVDHCERNPDAAFAANAHVVEMLADAIAARSATRRPALIHISTDQVYSGAGPHREDAVSPCNVYGRSKLAGELAATRVNATIFRTTFVGKSHTVGRTALTDWLVESLRSGKQINVFDDVLFSAWHASALCGAIATAAREARPGVYNAACCDGMSKAQFALRLASQLGLPAHLMTVTASMNVVGRAPRPLDMRLDISRFERVFALRAPTMDDQIKVTANDYRTT